MKVIDSIQAIQSLYSRGVQSDDTRLRPRQIWNKLVRSRATLLQQKSDKNQSISQWSYQTIPCIELIPAAPWECPCVPANGCIWLKSKFRFPEPVSSLSGPLIQSISSLDGNTIIDKSSFATDKYSSGNKYTSKGPRYILYNSHLFVSGSKRLRVIQSTIVANDPVDVWLYPSFCGGDECLDFLQQEMPLDNKTLDAAIRMASDELISLFTQLRNDKNNDSSDETIVAGLINQPKNS